MKNQKIIYVAILIASFAVTEWFAIKIVGPLYGGIYFHAMR